jgi:phosphatidylserine/phosphatidylglycerophosphate/cardiolipin synthase-like enzyme
VGGSLHAKYWVIQRTDESSSEAMAFVGGMDTTGGRYDTRMHNDDPERQMTTSWVSPFWGWHDNMFQIRGPAVVDVAHHFWALWTDPVRSMLLYPTDKFPWVPPPTATGLGSAQVQTLVTASCKAAVDTGVYSLFAERGETSVASAFYKLVANAKSYLYLEDQFMFFPEALAAVAAALPRLKAVVILTDPANVFAAKFMGMDFSLGYDMRRHLQYESLKLLMEDQAQAHKVHIFTLRRPGADAYHMTKKDIIYVHSKNYIADDDYAIVGSAGIERTGFTNDLDFAIGVQGDGFASSLRRMAWAEHLQVKPTDARLSDPIAAISLWEEQASNAGSRVMRYFPDGPVTPYKMLSFAEGIYEPDGRCGVKTRSTALQLGDANTTLTDATSFSKAIIV